MAKEFDKKTALAFIIAFGFVSFFADMAYEGMRGITGPYLAALGASGTIVGIVAGTGELTGYLLRLVTGKWAARTGAYWAITLFGYVIQMAAVPLLAIAGNWWLAALFIIAERTGKAVRAPAASFMKSRAGEHIGQGWAFGLHEAMDQTGAMIGPLITALVLAHHGEYADAFAWLGIPAALTLVAVVSLAMRFSYAGDVPPKPANDTTHADGKLPRSFWLYAASAGLVAFGFADYPLIAFHFATTGLMQPATIPVLYAIAMGTAGLGSLVFGRLYDRRGLVVLVPGIAITAAVAPLCFLGGFGAGVAGTVLWGVALGIHDAIMAAAVATMVPAPIRAHAYGVFPAVYGISWFVGSAAMGALYDVSLPALAILATAAQLAALPLLFAAMREHHKA
jgi:predicted MFS family arabinose efflux permease